MRVQGNTVFTDEVFKTEPEAKAAHEGMVKKFSDLPEKTRPTITLEGLMLTKAETFGSHEAAVTAAQAPGKKARAEAKKVAAEKADQEARLAAEKASQGLAPPPVGKRPKKPPVASNEGGQ